MPSSAAYQFLTVQTDDIPYHTTIHDDLEHFLLQFIENSFIKTGGYVV